MSPRAQLATQCALYKCKRPGPYRKGLCAMHYQRWHDHGDVLHVEKTGVKPTPPSDKPRCGVPECERPLYARDLCNVHYNRMRRTGALQTTRPQRQRYCMREGCGSIPFLSGLCHRHWLEHRNAARADA